jgi:Fe2+ transport system protein FeoA
MSSMRVVFSSEAFRPLSCLAEGEKGIVLEVVARNGGRADRLLSLGVTPGARITMLQTFPGIVFRCDETELAIERGIAEAIIIGPPEARS